MAEVLGILVAVFLLSWAGTWGVLRYAMQRDLLDHPNARSSHRVPTPRGGGLAIALAFFIGLTALIVGQWVDPDIIWKLIAPSLLVVAVGFWDDLGHVRARYRLLIHFAAAGWCVWWLLPEWELWALLLASIGLAWFLNLFNFMDGIDGIAASEAVFLALGIAAIEFVTCHDAAPVLTLILGAAAAGFLVWNWAPARIFMGDVGSGFFGLTIGFLLIRGSEVSGSPWPWLILPAVFVVDATLTLMLRGLRGERVYQAHRSHAYQVAALRWGHGLVTISVTLLNVVIVLPLALLVAIQPELGLAIASLTYVGLGFLALGLGAGRRATLADQEP